MAATNPKQPFEVQQQKSSEDMRMKISLVSVSVVDQKAALAFYTKKLGFIKIQDVPKKPTESQCRFISVSED